MGAESRSHWRSVWLRSTVTAALGATSALHQLFARTLDVTAPIILRTGENWPPLGSAPVGWRFSGPCAKHSASGNDEPIHDPWGLRLDNNLASGEVHDDEFLSEGESDQWSRSMVLS